ncbi:TrbM/KikA/MpfK family conjugal transfer protein [Campylobacter upsaliensis]
MKKILVSSFIAMSAISSMSANGEILGGDAGLACEAILCLSSPAKPSECSPSLARYFGISLSKPHKTAQARANFLNQCPASSMTPEMKQQVASLSKLTGYCTEDELNANVEKKLIDKIDFKRIYEYRISPKMTENCRILTNLNYSDYAFKYTCNQQFYNEIDWHNGYTKEEVSKGAFDSLEENLRLEEKKRIKVGVYDWYKLPANERVSMETSSGAEYYKLEPIYFKKHFIKKDCWVDAKKR